NVLISIHEGSAIKRPRRRATGFVNRGGRGRLCPPRSAVCGGDRPPSSQRNQIHVTQVRTATTPTQRSHWNSHLRTEQVSGRLVGRTGFEPVTFSVSGKIIGVMSWAGESLPFDYQQLC